MKRNIYLSQFFSTGVRSKNKNIQNCTKIFISKYIEIAKKEYAQIGKHLFYLNELLQITCCVLAKQKKKLKGY